MSNLGVPALNTWDAPEAEGASSPQTRIGVGRLPRAGRGERGEGSYEIKFRLRDEQIDGLLEWARCHIPADSHADTPGGDSYTISSLYFDTDGWDVFHQSPGYRTSKFRIRRYGQEQLLYLEQKRKSRGWVTKRRTGVAPTDLPFLLAETAPDGWAGDWFHLALRERRLAPRCQVTYRRVARVGEAEGSPIRLTMDRRIRCGVLAEIALPEMEEGAGAPLEVTILELKFRNTMPRLFKELTRQFRLTPTASSKYRQAVSLCGLLPVGG